MHAALEHTEPAGPGLTPSDLSELLSAFNQAAGRLQETHDQLRAEVARLTRELGEANEQLQRSQRLAALGEMAAGISHEIRNPLGGIRLYARMLIDDLAAMPQQRKLADKISQGARTIDGIVGDVLTFAKEFKLRPTLTDAGAALDAAAEACRHDGVPAWPTVTIRREPGASDVPLHADTALLQQALVNIIRNAIEAMEGGPQRSLVLSARRTDEHGRPCAELLITDTGPGVGADVMRRMFNPFFTTRAAGTGLGLAIVHRIADAHGGRVAVRNNADARPGEPGFGLSRGATFTLSIPDAPARVQDARESPAVIIPLSRTTTLSTEAA